MVEHLHSAGLHFFIFLLIASIHDGESEPGRCSRVNITDLGRSDAPSSDGVISQALGFPVQINRFNILCLSTSDTINRYQTTSVLVGYFCPTCPGNGTMEEIVEQFTFDCGLNGLLFAWNSSSVLRTIPRSVDFSTQLDVKCALCEHPNRLDPGVSLLNYNQSTHCIGK